MNTFKKKIAALLTSLSLVFSFYGCSSEVKTVVDDGGLTVHYIDVGQADAELLECGGEYMMIDGGNAADSSLVVSYLNDLGINRLKYVVATHAHEDHLGGLSGILSQYTADNVFCSQTSYSTKVFNNFKKYTENQGKEIQVPNVGDVYTLGNSEIKVLGPVKETNDMNNRSIVLRVTYGNTAFLFEGDAEREEEQDILNSGADVSADVLKVGHHGSSTSTTYPYLREVMPEYAVISCGKNNKYGHPHEETLSKLRDAGVKVYRTDESGHIVIHSDGNDITVQTEKNRQ